MGKFEQEAKDLLEAIGGKENITAVTHCATRMRFVLGDDKKADVKAIESISAVKGTFTNAGQFQVIIGNDVPIFYNDFTAVSGIEGVSKEAAKSAAKSNQNPVQRVMTTLAEIFTPIIPALIVGGLILGFRNVLEGVHWSMLDGKTITESSQFWELFSGSVWFHLSCSMPMRLLQHLHPKLQLTGFGTLVTSRLTVLVTKPKLSQLYWQD